LTSCADSWTLALELNYKWELDDLGEPHGTIVEGHGTSLLPGLHDPDGIEVRFYTLPRPDGGPPG